MTLIRSFRNADLPRLLELWIQHWSAIGPPPRVSAAKFEQAILSRTFFDPAALLIAEIEGVVQAWCHYAPSRRSQDIAVICAICLAPEQEQDTEREQEPEQEQKRGRAAAEELLAAAETRIAESGFTRIQAGLVRDEAQGYAGLEPIGHGIGIPVHDSRTTSLLQQAGFAPRCSVVRMTASVDGYRPPISRETLQLRRTSQVQVDRFIPRDSRQASGLSHFDVETHRLVDRGGQELARVKLWLSDPEAEVMSPSMVILDIAAAHEQGRLEPAERYLVGTVIQSLAQRRIQTVETAVDKDKTELLSQLRTLVFKEADEGVCWEKAIPG